MNYESVILELLSRIQALEERVSALEGGGAPLPGEDRRTKTSTADIRAYIESQKQDAREHGFGTLELRSGDIHRAMGLVSRIPMVCNAMRQCMREGDSILHETPSGMSSTLLIRYGLNG